MGFSKSQHAFHYRPMVQAAWLRHCGTATIPPDPKDKVAHDAWYREQLHGVLGVWTTKESNPKADFERLMAHFEELAGEGIRWQLRLEGGNARRLIHNIREECRSRDIEEDYARGIARQALRIPRLPLLEDLPPEQLLMLLKALRKDGERIEAFAHAGPEPEDENEPF